jgi:phosphatidylserine/phosphatidylglycerophosphate/cardiolipin synthase-like enzyme
VNDSGGAEAGVVDLSDVSTDDLEQIAAALSEGHLTAPVSPVALEHSGFGYLRPVFEPLRSLDPAALRAVLNAVLAERHRGGSTKLDLVWSGTDSGPSRARYTQLVLPELIGRARQSVTIAGYSFDDGAGLFTALRDALARGVHARLFLDIHQLHERLQQQLARQRRRKRLLPVRLAKVAGSEHYARAVVALFLELHWPFEGARPDLFYDPRTATAGVYASLHAKCVIVDCESTLITSANFTGRGQTRNIEVGALITDKSYATALEMQWNALVESGGVVRA